MNIEGELKQYLDHHSKNMSVEEKNAYRAKIVQEETAEHKLFTRYEAIIEDAKNENNKERKELYKYMREQILAGNFDMSIPRVLEIIDLKNLKLVRGACLIMKDFMEQVYEIEKGEGGILGHLCKHASIDVMKYISQKIRSENKEVKCVSGFQVVNDHSGNEDRMIEVINTFAQHGMDGINELKEKQYFLHHCLNKNYFKVVDFLIESGQLNAATFEYN